MALSHAAPPVPRTAAESHCSGMGPSTVGSCRGFPPWVFPAPSFAKQAHDVLETSVKFGRHWPTFPKLLADDERTDRQMHVMVP